jgi:hypothetical protein
LAAAVAVELLKDQEEVVVEWPKGGYLLLLPMQLALEALLEQQVVIRLTQD